MARSILIACLFLSLLSATNASFAAATTTSSAAAQCPKSELTDGVQDSPFYKLLTARYGKQTKCQVSQQDDTQSLSMQFNTGATLAFSVQSAIEFNQQSVTLPHGEKPLSVADAVKVLKATETNATGGDGCKIDWSRLAPAHIAANGQSEAEGKVCSCKAQLTRENGEVVKLGFSSAC